MEYVILKIAPLFVLRAPGGSLVKALTKPYGQMITPSNYRCTILIPDI